MEITIQICLSCSGKLIYPTWECSTCGWNPKLIDGVVSFTSDSSISKKGYDPSWYSELYTLEINNFWFIARNRLIQILTKRFLPKTGNYLEVGCGTGFVLSMIEKELHKWKIFATETQLEGINFARKRVSNIVSFYQMDACAIPFKNEFTAIGAFDVIEHIFDDNAAIKNIFDALESNGYFLLSVPQHMFLWSKYDEVSHHYRRYSSIEIKKKLNNVGFDILYCTSFNSLLLPFLMLSRMFTNRLTYQQVDVLDEMRLLPALNKFFYIVIYLEFILIKFGLKLPFGSSLIVVAKKPSEINP